MRGYMFRNRWFALLFVAMVLASVTKFVGTGKGDGAVDEATREIAIQQQQAAELSGDDASSLPDEAVAYEFTPDEELIDSATGEDPSPMIDEPAPLPGDEPAPVAEEDVVILIDQQQGQHPAE